MYIKFHPAINLTSFDKIKRSIFILYISYLYIVDLYAKIYSLRQVPHAKEQYNYVEHLILYYIPYSYYEYQYEAFFYGIFWLIDKRKTRV